MPKYLDLDGLSYFWDKITGKFVAKETGKGLSTNDFTTAEKNKLTGIESGAEVNVIEGISVNGITGTISNKVASVTVDAYDVPWQAGGTGHISSATNVSNALDLVNQLDTGDTNVIESISVNGTALTPVNKGVDIQTPQYNINGNEYNIVNVTHGTLNNVSGAYLMYDDGSIDLQSGGFFPDMVGMSYASEQILVTAGDNAQTIVNGYVSSSILPSMDGTASSGNDTSHFALADHVHPTDTSRQATLVSGTNIKTVNNQSLLGSGNIAIEGLPSVSSSDNGKVLRVVNGVWSAVSLPSASGVNF